MCLNPKDPEAHRIYTEGGVWPSLYAGQGGRCQAVLVGVLDLMGGNARMRLRGRRGVADPHKGRASASDVHAVVIEEN